MTLIEKLDAFITDMLGQGLTESEIAGALLFEDFQLEDPALSETVKRVRRKVSGINVTVRKVGRPNPLRRLREPHVLTRLLGQRPIVASRDPLRPSRCAG